LPESVKTNWQASKKEPANVLYIGLFDESIQVFVGKNA